MDCRRLVSWWRYDWTKLLLAADEVEIQGSGRSVVSGVAKPIWLVGFWSAVCLRF